LVTVYSNFVRNETGKAGRKIWSPFKLKDMRRFLYSKWFFLLLVIVCTLDLVADLGENIWGHNVLNNVAIGMDSIALAMAAWIFIDLHMRRPGRGDHTSH
jgi:hypothetical protein